MYLTNFPFSSFNEFKEEYRRGRIKIGVDINNARQWTFSIETNIVLKILLNMLLAVPYIAIAVYILYMIISQNWMLLIFSPILLISFFLFHPGARFLGIIRTIAIIAIHILFVVSIVNGYINMIAITTPLIVIYYCFFIMYRISCNVLIKDLLNDEIILRGLWNNKLMHIYYNNTFWFPSGRRYDKHFNPTDD